MAFDVGRAERLARLCGAVHVASADLLDGTTWDGCPVRAFAGTGLGATSLAAFGAAVRLEYLLYPLNFGLGAAVLAMVGSNIGAPTRRISPNRRPWNRKPRSDRATDVRPEAR